VDATCKLTKIAWPWALTIAERSSNDGSMSASRVSKTLTPCSCSADRICRANESTTSLSLIPVDPCAPGSAPPCAGSSTTTNGALTAAAVGAVGGTVCDGDRGVTGAGFAAPGGGIVCRADPPRASNEPATIIASKIRNFGARTFREYQIGFLRFHFLAHSPTAIEVDSAGSVNWNESRVNNKVKATFNRYIGIDYSGAETCGSRLKGLSIYAADRLNEPREVAPLPGPREQWTRKGIAEWLVERLSEESTTLIGIDHGFSFPLQYFEKYGLPHDWTIFLNDFQEHWPTDEDNTYVDFVRDGLRGNGAARCGDSHWRRITEVRARAKSVFHFDVPGSVAKSTHAGMPWLRYLRTRSGDRVHFWPFDGWQIPSGKSVLAEVYPALWSHSYPSDGRSAHQQDAYAAAEWLRRSDLDGGLERFFRPSLTPHEREVAAIEGWILGIA